MKIPFILLLFSFSQLSAQIIEVIREADTKYTGLSNKFDFLHNTTDTNKLHFVATLKINAKIKEGSINKWFSKMQSMAKPMGANLFKVKHSEIDNVLEERNLIIDLYYGDNEVLNENPPFEEYNSVYIFGNEVLGNSSLKFKLNEEKKLLASSYYHKYNIPKNGELFINKGGGAGTTLSLKWRSQRSPTFLSLTGLGFGVGRGTMDGSQVVTMSAGKINYIENNIGWLLVALLKEEKE